MNPLTVEAAVGEVVNDLLAAGARNLNAWLGSRGAARVTVLRPAAEYRDQPSAIALAMDAGADRDALVFDHDTVHGKVLVDGDPAPIAVGLVIQYGSHADYLAAMDELTAETVSRRIPEPRDGSLELLPEDARGVPLECAHDRVVDARLIDGCAP